MSIPTNVLDFDIKTCVVTVKGEARCMNCGRKWDIVVPFLRRRLPLVCPDCGQVKGIMPWPYAPAADQQVWKCECGNDLFFVTPEGFYCPNCGKVTEVDGMQTPAPERAAVQ